MRASDESTDDARRTTLQCVVAKTRASVASGKQIKSDSAIRQFQGNKPYQNGNVEARIFLKVSEEAKGIATGTEKGFDPIIGLFIAVVSEDGLASPPQPGASSVTLSVSFAGVIAIAVTD